MQEQVYMQIDQPCNHTTVHVPYTAKHWLSFQMHQVHSDKNKQAEINTNDRNEMKSYQILLVQKCFLSACNISGYDLAL